MDRSCREDWWEIGRCEVQGVGITFEFKSGIPGMLKSTDNDFFGWLPLDNRLIFMMALSRKGFSPETSRCMCQNVVKRSINHELDRSGEGPDKLLNEERWPKCHAWDETGGLGREQRKMWTWKWDTKGPESTRPAWHFFVNRKLYRFEIPNRMSGSCHHRDMITMTRVV